MSVIGCHHNASGRRQVCASLLDLVMFCLCFWLVVWHRTRFAAVWPICTVSCVIWWADVMPSPRWSCYCIPSTTVVVTLSFVVGWLSFGLLVIRMIFAWWYYRPACTSSCCVMYGSVADMCYHNSTEICRKQNSIIPFPLLSFFHFRNISNCGLY